MSESSPSYRRNMRQLLTAGLLLSLLGVLALVLPLSSDWSRLLLGIGAVCLAVAGYSLLQLIRR